MQRSIQKRRPRFSRTRLPGEIELTARDYEILEAVHSHRILSAQQLAALLPSWSRQTTIRRLQLLYHHGYLDRPRVQVGDLYLVKGSAPMAYALDAKGAGAISESQRIPLSVLGWRSKNRSLTRMFYEHTLFVSSLMVGLEVACRDRGNVELVPFNEILARRAPVATRTQKRPQTWRARVTSAESKDVETAVEIGVTPDKIFGIRFRDMPEGKNTAFFFLEADRAKMPVLRRNVGGATSIYKKLLAYYATHRQAIHTKRFGIGNFRALIVTTSQERVATMVESVGRLKNVPANLFLFTDAETFRSGDPLAIPWTNGKGESVLLGS